MGHRHLTVRNGDGVNDQITSLTINRLSGQTRPPIESNLPAEPALTAPQPMHQAGASPSVPVVVPLLPDDLPDNLSFGPLPKPRVHCSVQLSSSSANM